MVGKQEVGPIMKTAEWLRAANVGRHGLRLPVHFPLELWPILRDIASFGFPGGHRRFGAIVGFYSDSAGVSHGRLRIRYHEPRHYFLGLYSTNRSGNCCLSASIFGRSQTWMYGLSGL